MVMARPVKIRTGGGINAKKYEKVVSAFGIGLGLVYVFDVSCTLHPEDGCLIMSDVRKYYHQMIRDNMPALPKSAERDAKKEAAAEGEKLEEVTDKPDPQDTPETVCENGRKAVEVRKDARYESRLRGNLLARVYLYLRDVWKYKGFPAWDFDELVDEGRRLHCIPPPLPRLRSSYWPPHIMAMMPYSWQEEFSLQEDYDLLQKYREKWDGVEAACVKKELVDGCVLVHKQALRTSGYYDQWLEQSGFVAFGHKLEGHLAYFVETSLVYGGVFMAARVAFMLLIFLVNQYVLQRTKEQEMVQQYRDWVAAGRPAHKDLDELKKKYPIRSVADENREKEEEEKKKEEEPKKEK